MPAAEPRYCVAQVSEDARDGWRDFCNRHGLTRTAVAEIIGLWMADHDTLPDVAELVAQARALQNERKTRG